MLRRLVHLLAASSFLFGFAAITSIASIASIASITSCARGPGVAGPPTIGRSTEDEPLPPLPNDPGGPPSRWSEMSFDERKVYMTEHVRPTMEPLFVAFDPAHFDDFGCATCHGSHARRHRYRMPNPSLPVLPAAESPEWAAMMRERRHVFEFMAERVEVTMADLLDVAPYDPATHQGFGCFNCHTHEPH